MKKIIRIISYSAIWGVAALIYSCAPEACLEETGSFLNASLYNNTSKKKESPDSLTIYGLNHETNKIYDKTAGVQPALLPLNQSANNCSFIIRINGITDTITFNYTSRPHLVSKECGYAIFHNLIDTPFYTKNAIDYIYTASRNVTNVNEENIRIFY
jgi:hypothetical protein